MDHKEGKANLEKLQFIFHRIISGIIYWILSSFFIAYQQFVVKNFKNLLTVLLVYLVPFMFFLWFIKISMKRNQWKPFVKHSDVIGLISILIGFAIPFLLFLNVKVVQLFP
ncbi:hypothetical protein Desaci_0353 [Desulfosporosinus acidiphilus SJ4]|uniref:Uncharacterized protein n=1 Tax=Desulfosporosinus acidiphilus (strain DSM 22704 / JCM 16185 / SJ4) TaxID=646529 RepID=I4D0U7_DESAJ|nr:hypothetical protein [Desulfosporosinus acidiphilus]AFM39421.1 hypothetical protein Desaci_0353 [Desulfosporosinus acidiphilus SJ4]